MSLREDQVLGLFLVRTYERNHTRPRFARPSVRPVDRTTGPRERPNFFSVQQMQVLHPQRLLTNERIYAARASRRTDVRTRVRPAGACVRPAHARTHATRRSARPAVSVDMSFVDCVRA